MESSKFDLGQAVDQYITVISNKGSLTSSDATELSAHLFDSTEVLSKQGLSEEEAFLIATRRLGNEDLLAEEYSKVNPSVKTNKVWAYLMVGFNLFYGIPAAFFTLLALFYFLVHDAFQDSGVSVLMITGFHVAFIIAIWRSLRYKRAVSYFVEMQIERRPLRFIASTFLMLIAVAMLSRYVNSALPELSTFNTPVYVFNDRWIEFSYYAASVSLVGVAACLIFSVDKVEAIKPETFLQKPAISFLLVFGVMVELLAAATRAMHIEALVLRSVIFGLVYLAASYLISAYNRRSNVRYLFVAFLSGLLMEVGAGYMLLERRGFEMGYPVIAIVLSVAAGWFLSLRNGRERHFAD
ncbi:permease prefix domain 1-containing protein [Pedobacter deserti]|uniref:permease prefix domain 1-containing protein n=1 Tax=Pedobacter deserti TaxID=2817382 RepID=UPI00210A6D5F|nr:permease prefix domain 1-containing protein [Pedobacter sp. SYSU D00382]